MDGNLDLVVGELSRALAIYVGTKTQGNLAVGLNRRIWGLAEHKPEYDRVESGDWILFARLSDGSPRVAPDIWRSYQLRQLIVAKATSGFFNDSTPLWPDEGTEKSYPYRVTFEVIAHLNDIPLRSGSMKPDLSEAFRMSAINAGYLVDDVDEEVQNLIDRYDRVLTPADEHERWLFQSNPRQWDLEQHLGGWSVGNPDTWTVTSFREHMRAGDPVVLWQAGRRAGVYAFGELTGEPTFETQPALRAPDGPSGQGWRVPYILTRKLDRPILRAEMLTHPVLKDLAVIKFAQATNYRVTEDQWAALMELVERPDDMPADHGAPALDGSFDALTEVLVEQFLDERRLTLPRQIVAAAVAALRAGKNLILTGPPGTGKTEFAFALGEAATSIGLSAGLVPTTATADWTSIETIGGYRVDKDGKLRFSPGQVLDAIDRKSWLIIDEFNRADIDKAVGQLFSVLSGQAVTLPYIESRGGYDLAPSIVPAGADPPARTHPHLVDERWRIIATLNSRDRDLLFNMSDALLRRFAVIDVPNPPLATFRAILQEKAPTGSAELDNAIGALIQLPHRPASPAILIDCGQYLAVRRTVDRETNRVTPWEQLFQEMLFSFVVPQLDDLSRPQLQEIVAYLKKHVWTGRTIGQVASVLGTALQISPDDLIPAKPTKPAEDTGLSGEESVPDGSSVEPE